MRKAACAAGYGLGDGLGREAVICGDGARGSSPLRGTSTFSRKRDGSKIGALSACRRSLGLAWVALGRKIDFAHRNPLKIEQYRIVVFWAVSGQSVFNQNTAPSCRSIKRRRRPPVHCAKIIYDPIFQTLLCNCRILRRRISRAANKNKK